MVIERRAFEYETCDVWRKLVDWLVELDTESDVSNAGREVERAVEVRSQSKVCDL